MADALAQQLDSTKLSDGAASEDWKQGLSLPAKDTRQQTEDVTATKGLDFEDFSLSESC